MRGAGFAPGGGSRDIKRMTALAPWRLAVGNRRLGPPRATVCVMGDSTEEGIGAGSNDRTLAWPARLGASLRQRYPASEGGEISSPLHPEFIPACAPGAMHTSGVTSWWPIAAVPAGWTVDESRGPNAYALRATAAGSTLTLSIPANVSVTTVQLVSRRGPDATYGYTVTLNGGASTATTGTGTIKDGTLSAIQNVTTSVANTFVITAGGTETIIEGALLFGNNYNRGTVVYNLGKGGAKAVDYLPVSQGGKDWIKDNQSPTVDAGVQGLIDMAPDLCIRGGFYNDIRFSTGRSPQQYLADETALIAGCRSVLPSRIVPFILVTKWKPSDVFLVDATNYGRVWEDYVAARDAIAAADPYTLHLNLSQMFPQPGSATATALNAGYLDGVHGGNRIYGAVGDLVADFLSGVSL